MKDVNTVKPGRGNVEEAWADLIPLLARCLGLEGDLSSLDLGVREALEMAGVTLGGDLPSGTDLWDLDGTVLEVEQDVSGWRFRAAGARVDGNSRYHGLRCRRCDTEVSEPVVLPGRGYSLGPFHSACARKVETWLLERWTDGESLKEGLQWFNWQLR